MIRRVSVRFLAVLLFSLLFTQLDPGGAVICMADSGRISYSFSCACETPGAAHSSSCTACTDSTSHATATDAGSLSCCEQDNIPSESPQDQQDTGCCHNFTVQLIASQGLQVPAPGSDAAPVVKIHPLLAAKSLSLDQPIMARTLDLPPPIPERKNQDLLQLSSVRLLL